MSSNEPDNYAAGYTVKEMLSRMEGKVDQILNDHELRLRLLETDSNERKGRGTIYMSAAAFITAAAAAAGALFH